MSPLAKAFADIESREASQVAALDIGSNSFHLVVARILADDVQILHKVKQRVRLADGLDDNNILSQEAIDRGLDTLAVIAESLKGFEPDSVRIVATYTLRKAINADEFIQSAKSIFPYPIEVISGYEEARLIYSGVAHTQHDDGRRLVVDIGGGSTEFIVGEGYQPQLLRSLQMGCVSYTKRFFSEGVLKPKAFDAAITSAQQELEIIEDKYKGLGWNIAIGTSGTIKTIMNLCHRIDENCREGSITRDGLKALIKSCKQAGHVDHLEYPEISVDRRPVFAAGLSILMAIFKSLDIQEMVYSSAALREGVLYEMEDQLTQPDIRGRTAQSLAQRYDVDTDQAKRVLDTTLDLYDQVKADWKIKKSELRNMLGWASLLHEVGLQINSRGVQRHGAYILENVEMPGFNQEQQRLLARLVRYHRKKIRLAEEPGYYQYQDEEINKLLILLRLGVALNIKRQDGILPPIKAKVSKQTLTLKFPEGWLDEKPIFSADLERESAHITAVSLALKVS